MAIAIGDLAFDEHPGRPQEATRLYQVTGWQPTQAQAVTDATLRERLRDLKRYRRRKEKLA